MNFLKIDQTFGRIGIETQYSQVRLKAQGSMIRMHTTEPQIIIDQQLPRVLIDQRACFASAGYKSCYELMVDVAELSRERVMEYIAKYAQDGDMVAHIESGGNPISEIAFRDSFTQHEFNIDLIPKVRPKIDFKGYLNISLKEGKIQTNIEKGFLNINFTEPYIRMYLIQKPSLKIEYAGQNFDRYA